MEEALDDVEEVGDSSEGDSGAGLRWSISL